MNYNIKVYRRFEKEVKKLSKRYKSLKQDLATLATELIQNPETGTDLGNGLHKVRMSISSKGKGKRGGGFSLSVRIVCVAKIRILFRIESGKGEFLYRKRIKRNAVQKKKHKGVYHFSFDTLSLYSNN